MRQGYTEIAPGVGMPTDDLYEAPHVNWRHVDGPLMSWGGRMCWLSRGQRFRLWIGMATVDGIACEVWPERQPFVAGR